MMRANDSRYRRSEELLARACRSIPLGSQTFSKSYLQYPYGAAPFFVDHGKGSRVWDVDGNAYVDFVSALHAIILGYQDPDVDAAVMEQVRSGSVFTLPHILETEVAEAIIELVPSAQMVRFGKNGSDATSGAIRLARAHTGRDHVAVAGYHGWHDWYIGSTSRNLGVPEATRALTHRFDYNDIQSLDAVFKAWPGEIAAVILEVMNADYPGPGFLEEVCALTRRNGAVVIFDEIITGFRFSIGGAQALFGVEPDLTTLGKGLANGYPLSAIAGRADIMSKLEEVFFSFTMGGETIALAAARATLEKLVREPVLETIHRTGERLMTKVADCIARHGVADFLDITGHPAWSFLLIDDIDGVTRWEIKTLWLQELLARGFLVGAATHNINYAHSDADVDGLVGAYDEIFPLLKLAVERGDVRPFLRDCEPLSPLFRVR